MPLGVKVHPDPKLEADPRAGPQGRELDIRMSLDRVSLNP